MPKEADAVIVYVCAFEGLNATQFAGARIKASPQSGGGTNRTRPRTRQSFSQFLTRGLRQPRFGPGGFFFCLCRRRLAVDPAFQVHAFEMASTDSVGRIWLPTAVRAFSEG